MAATNYSPIQLYYSTTASAAPAAGNLVSGELAINITDGKLYYKDNAGTVQLLSTSTTANGTANGVLYLNGSKVATAGSALTFDGTGFQLSTSTGGNFYLNSTTTGTSNQIVSLLNNGNGYGNLNYKAFDHIWSYGATEQMRLTSTGLGIGTSSPAYKLDVNGVTRLGAGSPAILAGVGGAFAGGQGELYTIGTNTMGIGTTGAAALRLYTNSTLQATIDSSGNLGLGVTPSAWRSGAKAFQLGATGYASLNEQANGSTSLNFNCYESAANTWTYFVTGVAPTRYTQLSGAHAWFTAPSGTAGNAITFTQAMTLDASGNLLVGGTTNSGSLKILATDGTVQAGFLPYAAGSIAYTGTWTNHSFGFATNGTERARIDSSGKLLVGTTTVGYGSQSGFTFAPDSASYYTVSHASGSSSGNGYAYYAYNGSLIGSITQSGTTGVLYNITSDQRLKENIADADSASALIDSLQVRKFDWKADGNHQRYGFIAQELVAMAPEAVHQPADPEEMMAVDYSKLVPMLVKEIQSLRKRLADAGIA